MANNFIPVRLEYSGGSMPTGWAEYQTGETMVLPGSLNLSGDGRRISAPMGYSPGNFAGRLIHQSSVTNQNTFVSTMPNGTSTTSGFQAWASSSDLENSSRGDFYVTAAELSIASGRTGTGTYLPMNFYTGGAERMRIDTSGYLMYGQSNITGMANGSQNKPGSYLLSTTGAQVNQCGTDAGLYISKPSGYSSNAFQFYFVNGTQVGSITTTGAATAYNTSSDRRLKDKIADADADAAWERLDGYRIRSFEFRCAPGVLVQFGVIADEAPPEMVTGEKDAVREFGSVYVTRPVGTLYALNGDIISEGVEEPTDYDGYWMFTGNVEFLTSEDHPKLLEALPGVRWEKTREEILPQGVDWMKPVPELILNQQTTKTKIIALEQRAAAQDQRIAELSDQVQQLLDRLSA